MPSILIDYTQTPKDYPIQVGKIESTKNNKKHPITTSNYRFKGNGKNNNAPLLHQLYTFSPPQKKIQFTPSLKLAQALKQQVKVLKRRAGRDYKLDNLNVDNNQLLTVAEKLYHTINNGEQDLSSFELYKIKGNDDLGNVQFTSYYVPTIKASKIPNDTYKYPLYQKPNSWPNDKKPSRKDIDQKGALKNQGLEIAYTASPLHNYNIQVQGSGYIVYEDGSQELLSYGGNNGFSYQSVGKQLVDAGFFMSHTKASSMPWLNKNVQKIQNILYKNPSYTFFKSTKAIPSGAAGVPLTAEYSIAVDPNYIPIGSCLLALVPVLNTNKHLSHHEFRILVAQDKGAAIKGPGHVDLYNGIGTNGEAKANSVHHYGNLWLLLPKES